MDLVRIHKEFNRSAIPFYREIAIDFFGEIMKKWNNMYEYEPLVFNATELKKALNLENSKNSNYFNDFILQFAKDHTTQFELGENIITGNAFSFSENTELDIFTVHLNDSLKEYIFTKSDIELMQKSKRNQKMTILELEKYKQDKEKYKSLMLFSQYELLKLNSKYTKRFYMLIVQFKETGKFIMMYDKFKKVMGIPDSYRQYDIDRQVLKKAKSDIEKNLEDIRNIQFFKIKKGKSIEKIEITFDCDKERFKKLKTEKENFFEETDNLDEHIDFEKNLERLSEFRKEFIKKKSIKKEQ